MLLRPCGLQAIGLCIPRHRQVHDHRWQKKHHRSILQAYAEGLDKEASSSEPLEAGLAELGEGAMACLGELLAGCPANATVLRDTGDKKCH